MDFVELPKIEVRILGDAGCLEVQNNCFELYDIPFLLVSHFADQCRVYLALAACPLERKYQQTVSP